MTAKKAKTTKPEEPQHRVILRAEREGIPSIWRSSDGFVSILGHENLAFPGSEVFVKRVYDDPKIGWEILGPVPAPDEKDQANGANY